MCNVQRIYNPSKVALPARARVERMVDGWDGVSYFEARFRDFASAPRSRP